MRKLLVISCMVAYTCAQLGVLAWYYGPDLIHGLSKKWQEIHNSGLTHATMDLATYLSLSNSSEITLNGTLYDITGCLSTGNKVELTLERDEFESCLLRGYKQVTIWMTKHHSSPRSDEFVLSWMTQLFFSNSFSIDTIRPTIAAIGKPVAFDCAISTRYMEKPAQPPEHNSL